MESDYGKQEKRLKKGLKRQNNHFGVVASSGDFLLSPIPCFDGGGGI